MCRASHTTYTPTKKHNAGKIATHAPRQKDNGFISRKPKKRNKRRTRLNTHIAKGRSLSYTAKIFLPFPALGREWQHQTRMPIFKEACSIKNRLDNTTNLRRSIRSDYRARVIVDRSYDNVTIRSGGSIETTTS